MIRNFSNTCCCRIANDNLYDPVVEVMSINSKRGSHDINENEMAHLSKNSVVVPSIFTSSKDGVLHQGLFVPIADRNIKKAGTVEGMFCKKIRADGMLGPSEKCSDVDNGSDIWLLKSVHTSSLLTTIKRKLQSWFYLLLSKCSSGSKCEYYFRKSLYFSGTTILYFREEAGARLMNLVLGKLPEGEVGIKKCYQSRVHCEIDTLNHQCFPVLAVKDISPCELVSFKKLIRKLKESDCDSSLSSKDHFESGGDPALIYFLRALLLGDEDCLKEDNYLLKKDEGKKPKIVGIDFGMAFYRDDFNDFDCLKTKKDCLKELMNKSWKHSIQYSGKKTIIELLNKMEALFPGYLSERLDDALALIDACTKEELIECIDRVSDRENRTLTGSVYSRMRNSLIWRKNLVTRLLTT